MTGAKDSGYLFEILKTEIMLFQWLNIKILKMYLFYPDLRCIDPIIISNQPL